MQSMTNPPAPEGDSTSFLQRQKERVEQLGSRAEELLAHRRDRSVPVDLAVELYERDRDTFAAVLGSAIAFRLFLFQVPMIVAFVGFTQLLAGRAALSSAVEGTGISGSVAAQVEDAANVSQGGSLILALTGLFLTLLAGRSLTRVLAACSGGAWGLTGREAKATVKMAASVSGMVIGIFMAAAVLNRVRADSGVAVAVTGLAGIAVLYGLGWFFVTWTLPARTTDPGAMLPGAALLAVSMTGLQWFMQFYLPDRLARASDVMGSVGLTVAILGFLFFVGRIMASSFVLNAVVFERFGSISELVFALPGIRRIPEKSTRVAKFFDLERYRASSVGSDESID